MTTIGPSTACQICGSQDLRSVLFLGFLPPVNVMREAGKPHREETWLPAELLYCGACHLVQLGYIADPALIFPPEYPYRSGTTRILRENFADLHVTLDEILHFTKEHFVVDIGSNDGTLLKNFAQAGIKVLGIEPSLMAEFAQKDGVPSMMAFFGPAVADQVAREHGHPDVVTAANVFAHIADINAIVDSIAALLKPDGVFVSESHYLLDLVRTLQYDTVYHEHLRYYSLHSIRHLLAAHGFRVFKAQRIPTHGGSIRVFATRGTRFADDDSVQSLLAEEQAAGLTSDAWIPAFRKGVIRSKLRLYALLSQLHDQGKRIVGISAPSRGSTLVNYVGLDDGILENVMEVQGSKKIGKYIPGTAIPVIEESTLYTSQPDYAFLLSWHIGDELMRSLKSRGFRGDFIIPLPEPRIVRNSEVS